MIVMPQRLSKWTILTGVFLVAAAAAAGALSPPRPTLQSMANSTQGTMPPSTKPGSTGKVKGPTEHLPLLRVTDTSLPEHTIRDDEQFLTSLFSGHPGDGALRGPSYPIYNIDVRVDPNAHIFTGHLDIHFHNNLGADLDHLYFNVWPNATHFRKSGGWEQVMRVRQGALQLPFQQIGTVLTVHFLKPVRNGAAAELSLDFQGRIPRMNDRYGYQGTTITMGNWYPVLAVHDAHGWITPPYFPDGESFYSLTGVYHLHVTLPTGTVLAVGGEQTGTRNNGDGTTTFSYVARGVRDVAWVADPKYHVMTTKTGNTTIYTYFRPDQSNQAEQARLMADIAKQSVEAYSRQYGPYPYPTLRVCAMEGWFGGMEYPQLVMISFPSQRGNSELTTRVDVAHEVAHQWFYGMIGDDEYLTPWMDEAFAQYSEMQFNHRLNLLDKVQFPGHPSYSVSAFPNSDYSAEKSPYFATVYAGGAEAIHRLQQRLGDAKFAALMRAYFNQYEYQVATTADFIQMASKAAGEDLTPFFVDELNIDPTDEGHSPVQDWVARETAVNGRDWVGP
jgi:hypothetical protein